MKIPWQQQSGAFSIFKVLISKIKIGQFMAMINRIVTLIKYRYKSLMKNYTDISTKTLDFFGEVIRY